MRAEKFARIEFKRREERCSCSVVVLCPVHGMQAVRFPESNDALMKKLGCGKKRRKEKRKT